jgi:hypothetical protein
MYLVLQFMQSKTMKLSKMNNNNNNNNNNTCNEKLKQACLFLMLRLLVRYSSITYKLNTCVPVLSDHTLDRREGWYLRQVRRGAVSWRTPHRSRDRTGGVREVSAGNRL